MGINKLRFKTTLVLHHKAQRWAWYRKWHHYKHHGKVHGAFASVYASLIALVMILNLFGNAVSVASWQSTAAWGSNEDFLTNASTTGDPSDRSNVDVNDGKVTLARTVRDKVETFDAGAYHSLAISTDNKVYSTGQNTNGKLGNNSTFDEYSWVETQNAATPSPEMVTAGFDSSLLLNANNTIATTGYGSWQLGGAGSSTVWTTNVLQNVTKVSTSGYGSSNNNQSLAIDQDGSLWVTGNNQYGQLGLGDTNNRGVWVKTSLTNVVDISAGAFFSYAVVEDSGAGTRTLYVAGYNLYGQLGMGDTTQRTTWTATNKTNVRKAVAGKYNSEGFGFYVDTEDNLFAAGRGNSYRLGFTNQTQQNSWIQTATGVKDVAAGYDYTLIVKNDGTVWATGVNTSGQLGMGDLTQRNGWTQTPLANVSSVSCGYAHTLVLLNDRSLLGIGSNIYGQLGTGDIMQWRNFTDQGLSSVTGISTGSYHSVAITSNNKIFSTGQGLYGKLGTGNVDDQVSFTETQNSNTSTPTSVSAGNDSTLVTNQDGFIATTGYGAGQLGGAPTTSTWYVSPKFTKISSSGYSSVANNHSLAIDQEGNLWVTGYNANGQLGLGDTTNRGIWTKTSLTNVVDVSAGAYFSYAVVEDSGAGTRTLFVTGNNSFGQLGMGDSSTRTSWTATTKTNVLKVVAGKYNSDGFGFYIDVDSNLFAVGRGSNYHLGFPNTTTYNVWTQTSSGVTDVSTGYDHSTMIKNDGTLWATGVNSYGQLGMGDTNIRGGWTQAPLTGASFVSCGYALTLVLLNDGTVRGAGANTLGELGMGDNINKNSFSNPGLAGITAIAAGSNHSVAISSSKVYTTGQGTYGKLGTGNTSNRNTFIETQNYATPVPTNISAGNDCTFVINQDGVYATSGYGGNQLGGTGGTYSWYVAPKFNKISTSSVSSTNGNHSLAIDQEGNLWVTGYNVYGQLGLGDTSNRGVWTKTSLTNVVDVSAGAYFSYAVVENSGAGTRTLYVAGYNNYGQLGMGDTTQRTSWTATTKTNVSKVVAGRFNIADSFGFYIDTSGNLYAAGRGVNYRLGLANQTQQNSWVQTATGVMDVSPGYDFTVMIKNDGTVWATGANTSGQLGMGDLNQRNGWTQTPLTGAASVSCGYAHAIILLNNGTTRGAGSNTSGQLGGGYFFMRKTTGTTISAGVVLSPFPFATSGYIRGLYLGGETPIVFYGFSWDIIENSNSNVKFRFRHADTQGGLAGAEWSQYYEDTFNSGVRVADNWFEFELSLYTNERNYTPSVESFTALYYTDALAPNNVTSGTVTAWADASKTIGYASDSWHNDPSVYFEWSAPTDNGESGVAGYYVYFGPNELANPQTDGEYQVSTNYTTDISDNTLSGDTLYLSIRAIDNAGNIYTIEGGDYSVFEYKYDNEAPLQPANISVSPMGWTTVNDFTFSWEAASDTSEYGGISGVTGYEYKLGEGEWVATDLLGVANLQAYQNGQNIFYLRSLDLAGNRSSAKEKNYLFNGAAPSAPTDLAVTPQSATENSFTFSWDLPETYNDGISGYRYSINVPPSDLNTSFTTETSLGPIPAATLQGLNTFYILAVDVAGNYSYAEPNIETIQFECVTTAPGIPVRPNVTDYSDRLNSDWKLVVSWQQPTTGGNVAKYIIERATEDPESDDSWTEAGTSTTTTFAEAGLDNSKTYYYRIQAVDNAGSPSAASEVVYKQPTGKFTSAPTIVSGPEVRATAVGASVTWVTDRASSSFVEYSTDTDFDLSNGSLTPVTEHEVVISGLLPGTNYQYRVQSLDEQRDYEPSTAYSLSAQFETSLAPSISNVEIADIGLHSAIISWKTTSSATSKIMYGTSTDYGFQYVDNSGSSVTTHTVKLQDLEDSTTYNFKIQGVDVDDNILTSDNYAFTTLTYPVISSMKIEQIPNKATSTIKVKFTTNVPTTSMVSASGKVNRESSVYEFSKEHEVVLSGLADNSLYTIIAQGRDRYGNEAKSVSQQYKTDFDTRPPSIFNVTTESEIQGVGIDAKGQLIVSWETDEPSTSQIEYGTGSSGGYTSKTREDISKSNTHVVVISELKPSSPYHFRVVSTDDSENQGTSEQYAALTPQANRSVFDVILSAFDNALGWFFRR